MLFALFQVVLCIVQQACILWETDTIKEQSGSASGATSIENLFSIFYHQPTQSQQTQNTNKQKTQTQVW